MWVILWHFKCIKGTRNLILIFKKNKSKRSPSLTCVSTFCFSPQQGIFSPGRCVLGQSLF